MNTDERDLCRWCGGVVQGVVTIRRHRPWCPDWGPWVDRVLGELTAQMEASR